MVGLILCSLILLFGCVNKATEKTEVEGKEEQISSESKSEEETKDKLGSYTVQLDGEVHEEGDKFIIEGKSNLLPGSRLVSEVVLEADELHLDDEVFSDSTELVDEQGNFRMELEHHQYGEAEILVRFDFEGQQEDDIKRHYGERGQKLDGPFVYKHEHFGDVFQKAEVSVTYDPDEPSDLVFKQPNWHDLPDDYGDPRVWIEIEDISDDGEFFYIHGISNLLEGSLIEVSYGFNSNDTQVQPDGSFDVKIDYEYLEDTDFIVEFNPGLSQWNSINEVYGDQGEKLVGNLVVQHDYSDKQSIEAEIPWELDK